MKKLLLACGVIIGLLVGQTASATPLLINPDFGTVIIPANETDELAALVAAITAWNATHNPDVPDAGAIDTTPQLVAGAVDSGTGHANTPGGSTSITLDFSVEQETYVGLTWDGPNGGTLFYYVGDETGEVTFTSPFFPVYDKDGNPKTPKQYNLSHYMFTGPLSVPDGGTTASLLGLSMLGLGYLRRRKS